MRVTNKIAAMLCSATMLLGNFSLTARAANNDIGNSSITINGETTSMIQGTPSTSSFVRDVSAGNLEKEKGQNGFWQRLPRKTMRCPYCNEVAVEYIPIQYAGVSYSASNQGIIGNCTFNVAEAELGIGEEYAGLPCFEFDFTALKPGSTEVNLTYYYRYDVQAETGTCNNCGQYISVPADNNWYKETASFTVDVKGEELTYSITYTDGVPEEIVFPDQGYEGLNAGETTPAFEGTPVREGYTFMGWAPAVSPTVTEDVTYVATWKRNEPVVDPTEPDDPNAKTTDPTVTKTIDNNVSSVAPGDSLGYTITTNVPDYLGKYLPVKDKNGNVLKEGENNSSFILTVHDDMDDGITVDASSVAVKFRDTVIPESFYTVNLTPECDKHCDFHVSMDLVKLYEGGYINKEDIADAENIIITYSATVNEDITPGSYKNTAWVEFTGSEEPSEPDDPDVDVYGIYLKKVDQDDETKVLSGAEFTLYSEDKTTVLATAVSDVNGIAKFNVSLKAGTYYVKETKAPEGYVASSDFIEVIIQENDSSVQTENKEAFDYYYKGTEVPNVSVPETGGTGTDALYLTGFGIVAAAGLIYFITRRKRTA